MEEAMGHRWKQLLGLGLLLALVASSAWAQDKTTGALTGKVIDESGAALPGVSIEIRGTTLIGGAHLLVTDKAGRFRLPQIPPGVYTVVVSLQGFQTVKREELTVTLGNTVDVPISLKTETISETVEVIGEAPTIDVTSAATSTNLPNEILQNLPTARFQPAALNLAPGINQSSAYGGGDGSGNSYQIDGVDVSDPQSGTPWAFVDYNIIKEVQLVGLGAPAEYGGFTGVVFNSVTQSGGNKIKGLAETLYTNKSLTDNNSNVAGINPTIKKSSDSTLQLGGPLAKDKLWYFISGQYINQVTNNGGPDSTEKDPRIFGKLTWQATQSSSIESWVEGDKYDVTGRGGSVTVPLEATVKETAPELVWNFSDRTVLSENTILSIAEAGYNGYYYLDPQSGPDLAGHLSADTGFSSVNSTFFYKANRTRNQLNGSLSHYASNFIKGDHDFKFGMELERSTVQNRYGYNTGVWFYDHAATATSPAYSTGYYGHGYNVHARNERLSTYAQDTWRVGSRLTINPGLRLDLDRGYVQSGNVYKSNPLAPRLGFAWDLTGDGKTLLKAHAGRYYEAIAAQFYYWVDPGAFQTGYTQNILPGQPPQFGSSLPGGNYDIDPHARQPYLDQVILGLDRELIPGITFSGTLVYRENKDFLETVSKSGAFAPVTGEVGMFDPNTGTFVGTGQRVTLYNYLTPDIPDTLIVTNPKGLKRTYRGAIFSVTRRFKDNWQLIGSYVYSKTRGNFDNTATTAGGDPGGPGPFLDTPNSLVNANGILTHDQTNQVKLQGTYLVPKLNLSFSGNYTYFTGDTWTPLTNCLLQSDGSCFQFNQGTVRFFADSRGSRRLPAWNQIDLRGEWHIPGLNSASLLLDVFNVTNQGIALSVSNRENSSSFGQPATYTLPRNYRLGLHYTF
jgi:outer membrane receptor protein involved in Fe transport